MRYGAVVVAAGMSSRMKQFKQLMKIGDMSLAERVITNFRRAGVRDIVMVTGNNAEQLERALRNFGIIFVRNERYDSTEMFDSARLGLEAIQGRCDRVFFCPVDVPFFTDETVATELKTDAKVVIPVHEGRDGHPILIDSCIIPDIIEHDGTMGLKGAIDKLPADAVVRITVDDEGAVIDADTREDFQRLVDLHNSRILHPEVKISFASTTSFFGPGTVQLLREIECCGNVREACEKCGISYSKAWNIIRNCEEKFGYSIVERRQGGQNGGMASVTDKGRDLLNVYEKLHKEISEFTETKFRSLMREYDLTGAQENNNYDNSDVDSVRDPGRIVFQ